jgi:hypothetical protein
MSVAIDAPAEVADHIPHFEGIGPGGQNTVLRAFQLRRRDHFHGLRNFLRFFNGIDLSSDGLETGHIGLYLAFVN